MTQRFRLPFAGLVCLAAGYAQSVTGRWLGNASANDDGLEMIVALNQAGGKITGYINAPRAQDTIVRATGTIPTCLRLATEV